MTDLREVIYSYRLLQTPRGSQTGYVYHLDSGKQVGPWGSKTLCGKPILRCNSTTAPEDQICPKCLARERRIADKEAKDNA